MHAARMWECQKGLQTSSLIFQIMPSKMNDYATVQQAPFWAPDGSEIFLLSLNPAGP